VCIVRSFFHGKRDNKANNRRTGLAKRHDNHQRQAAAGGRSKFGGAIKEAALSL
jgi:hypothetical protein